MPRPNHDPRSTRAYRTAAAHLLAHDDLCHLCGHHGARTADHLITVKDWYQQHGSYDGVHHPTNLAPAHGTHGRDLNPCPTCGQLCNQARGARTLQPEPRSRDW